MTERESVSVQTQREHGQSMVEFAVVLPVLLLTVFGMILIGISMHNNISLTQAATIGVHQAAIDRNGDTDPCSVATTAMLSALPALDHTKLNFSLTINGNAYTGLSCSGATSQLKQGQIVSLTVTYPCSQWSYGTKLDASCVLAGRGQELIQ